MKDNENDFGLPFESQPELFSMEWARLILEQGLKPKTAGGTRKVKKATNPLGKKGGRNARVITREDFLKKVIDLHNKKSYTSEEHWVGELDESLFSLAAFMESSTVVKDLSKISFDTENHTADESESSYSKDGSLLGLQSLDNGLEFIGFIAGGDWEKPLFLIIYWDGKSFRGYIPTYGNVVNTDFKCAFGSEMDSDYGPYGEKAQMMRPEYEGKEDYELTIECMIQLGFTERSDDEDSDTEYEPDVDWKHIKEDIMNRIAVS